MSIQEIRRSKRKRKDRSLQLVLLDGGCGVWSGVDVERPACLDLNRNNRLVAVAGLGVFDLLDDIKAFDNGAEDDVLAVEPWGLDGGDEELGAVGILASIGHRQHARSVVLQLEIFVRELGAVYGLAPGPVALGEVTALDHEALNNSVERAALVAEGRVARLGQLVEVLDRLWHNIPEEPDDDSAQRLATPCDVEVDLVSDLWKVAGFAGAGGRLRDKEEQCCQNSKERRNKLHHVCVCLCVGSV